MTVSIADVAVELARPTPESPTADQWQSWIFRAYRLIEARLGPVKYAALDADLLDDVVLSAVAEHVRAWRDSTANRRTVAVDDGSVSYSYESSVGFFAIPGDLWSRLDPTLSDSGAFTVTPAFESDAVVPESWA